MVSWERQVGLGVSVLLMEICFLVCPAVAQDKKKVLCAVDADGKNLRRVFEDAEYITLGSPAFSPDGTRIALDAWKASQSYGDTHILIVNADGSGMVDLGPGAMPSWSADGSRLAFSSYEPSGVWTMRIDGMDRREVDRSGWGIQWSPDGQKLAYTRSGNITVHDVKTGASKPLWPNDQTPYARVYWNMTWAPDSRRLCFVGQTEGGEKELAIVDIQEGPTSLQRLYRAKRLESDVAWHPDGRRIVFSTFDTSVRLMQLFQLKLPWGAEPALFPGQVGTVANVSPSWSPDGKTLVFMSRQVPGRPAGVQAAQRREGHAQGQPLSSTKLRLILGNVVLLLLFVAFLAIRRVVSGRG